MIEVNGYKFVESDRKADKRASTFIEKEPGTTKWIQSFTKNDIFIDIGANVGIYTIFAADKASYVFSFEPHVGNFHQLCKNVYANKYNNVILYNLALSNRNGLMDFVYESLEIGAANNQLDIPENNIKNSNCLITKQWSYTLDDMVRVQPSIFETTKIKIDVDGIEYQILETAQQLIGGGYSKVKEIMVEYNIGDGNKIEHLLKTFGFSLKERQLTAGGLKRIANNDIMNIPHNMLFTR
jgi:FkbM family methyltransferase